jgi:hypothetical protein
MTTTAPRHTLDELRVLGEEILHRVVLPNATAEQDGQFVAINVDTGGYEIDPKLNDAIRRHLSRDPDSYLWLARIGHPAVFTQRFRP